MVIIKLNEGHLFITRIHRQLRLCGTGYREALMLFHITNFIMHHNPSFIPSAVTEISGTKHKHSLTNY